MTCGEINGSNCDSNEFIIVSGLKPTTSTLISESIADFASRRQRNVEQSNFNREQVTELLKRQLANLINETN